MCSEAVWWRCHRRIVADYLLIRGRTVFHLMGVARIEPAALTVAARARGSAVVYPAGSPNGTQKPCKKSDPRNLAVAQNSYPA
jgi:hypothetical protein